VPCPTFTPIEFRDELEEAKGGGVDVAPELEEFGFEGA
jgi:hypothetical protein